MMDNDTKFQIAQEVDDSKFKHDAQSLLKMGKQVTKKTPSVFVTDGLPAYNDTFKKEFVPKNFLHKPSEHVKDIHFKNQVANNNIQERLNGEFRDREKIFRELKKNDSPAIYGIKLYHNYIRPHMGLNGDTSVDRAGIQINGSNKWKTIIQNANKKNYIGFLNFSFTSSGDNIVPNNFSYLANSNWNNLDHDLRFIGDKFNVHSISLLIIALDILN